MSCTVPSCKNIKGLFPSNSNLTFHRFPQGDRFIIFKNKIKYPQLQWNSKKYICSEHFTESDFIKNGSTRILKKTAVPSLKLSPIAPISKRRVTLSLSSENENCERILPREVSEITDKLPNERLEFITIVDDSVGASSDEQEHSQKSGNSTDDENEKEQQSNTEKLTVEKKGESEKEQENNTIEVSDSDSSQWSLPELSLLSSGVPVLPENSDGGLSPEHNDQSTVSSSISQNCDSKKVGKKRKKKSRSVSTDSSDDYFSDEMAEVRAIINYKQNEMTVKKLRRKVTTLQSKNRALTQKVKCLESLFTYLEKNNFLNQYASAAIKAVVAGEPGPP